MYQHFIFRDIYYIKMTFYQIIYRDRKHSKNTGFPSILHLDTQYDDEATLG